MSVARDEPDFSLRRSRSSDEDDDDSSDPPQPESTEADGVVPASDPKDVPLTDLVDSPSQDSDDSIEVSPTVNENDLNLLPLRRLEPYCQYCGQCPADFKCYDCWKTIYCGIECMYCDFRDHAAACALLQL